MLDNSSFKLLILIYILPAKLCPYLICYVFCSLQVRICREKSTSHVYAMKKLKKSEMLRRGQVEINYCFEKRTIILNSFIVFILILRF